MHEWKLVQTLYMAVALVSSVSVRTWMNCVFFPSTYNSDLQQTGNHIQQREGGGIIIANTASCCAWLLLVLSAIVVLILEQMKFFCLMSLFSKAGENHLAPSLFSAIFPDSLSASCSSICTQILVSLFSAITNARTAALPGCSAGAKLRLLRLMMAGTMNVG